MAPKTQDDENVVVVQREPVDAPQEGGSNTQTEKEAEWHKDEDRLVAESGIDRHDVVAARESSLARLLVGAGLKAAEDQTSLVKALVALGEATAHIAVHLQNYVEHTYAGSQNASGDEQLHLDILCDEEVFRAVRASKVFATVASEETPEETTVGSGPTAVYSLGCDPLDGSSIIDANFSVGSIYGIWPGTRLVGRTGREQVASAVALYGPRTLLLIALPAPLGRVIELTLVRNRTCWEVSRENVTIAPTGKVFAPGNLRAVNDNPRYAAMVNYWMQEQYQLRYSGGMVPDVYHIFAKGKGVFANVSSATAQAKLRLLYEVAPLGLLVECAGGVAINESPAKSKSSGADGNKPESVLDIVIEHTDHRLGVCFGSSAEVEKYQEIMFFNAPPE